MKIKTLFTAAAVLALTFTLALVSCFSPWQGDEATLTISVGSGSPRGLVNTQDKEQDSFSYEVIMTGPGGKLNFKFEPGALLTVKVIPGRWQVEVRAMGTHNYAAGLFPNGDILRAFGEWEGAVGGNTSASITMYSASEVSSWAQLEAAIDYIPDGDRKEIILLKNGEWTATGSSGITIARPIELRAVEAVTIFRELTFDQSFFNVEGYTPGSGQLTLKGPLTLDGTLGVGSYTSCLIGVNGDDAKLEIYDGVILQNNTAQWGGGVAISGGTFTMYGGTIKGNNTTNGGGGVYVGGGTFNMTGGSISINTVTTGGGGKGGGVYVAGGTFKMSGNASVSYNSSNCTTGYTGGSNGGGVYVASSGEFIMNGGSIKENTTLNEYSGGGGVYVNGGTFNMNSGSIKENTSSNNGSSGGGVYVTSSGRFTMTDGTVSGNEAFFNGGGVFVSNSDFTMSGGTIGAGNTAQNGGGVHLGGDGTLTMNGGTISGNTATSQGGGVYVGGDAPVPPMPATFGTFRITNGTIYGNESGISPSGLKNNAADGAALYNMGTAQTTNNTPLTTIDTTIRVVNGELR